MQIIQSTILIHAPKSLVWNILMDIDNYNKWNPFTPKVETNFKMGSKIILHVNMTTGKKLLQQTEQILWVKEEESVAWGIEAMFPVRTERAQILTEKSPTETEYHTYDKFWGILVPLVMWMYRDKVQTGFDSVALGLKNYAEQEFQRRQTEKV
jgi:hypothetical protein